VDAEIREHKRL
jgi:hypothetical protein